MTLSTFISVEEHVKPLCVFSSDQVAFSLCVFVSSFLLTNRRVTQERHSATLSTALLSYRSLPTSVSPHKGLLSSIRDGDGSILRRPQSASLFWSNHKNSLQAEQWKTIRHLQNNEPSVSRDEARRHDGSLYSGQR